MSSTFQLVVRAGNLTGQSFALDRPEIVLGRDLANDIVVTDAEVSRRHARIFLKGDNYVLEDLGSTNGTFVNGQRLTGPYILQPGEYINLGENATIEFVAVEIDPDATLISSNLRPAMAPLAPEPAYAPPPEQPAPLKPMPAPMPAPAAPQPAYVGQAPAQPSPVINPPARKKMSWIIWVLIALGVLILGCILLLVIIDVANLWCTLGGSLFNNIWPGSCP